MPLLTRREPVLVGAGAATAVSSSRDSTQSVALTIGRLAFIPAVIATLGTKPAVTAMLLAAFVALDVVDGVLARRDGVDGPARRALDSVIDRLSIVGCLIAAWAVGLLPAALLAAFLLRDAYCAALCIAMVRRTGSVVKADWTHRTLNLLVAAWGASSAMLASTPRNLFAVAILLVAIGVAFDLRRMTRNIQCQSLSGQVVPAAAARRTCR